ncbi:hypothetical protein GCM10010988_17480 [Cnuibacter physcomitrellae]|uniref:hypothetical protein n=1 Tax=Cnuibacter physcomitrellae TaxID=1619308 RepID=UPI0012F4A41C|nr:hypothetical protein [Cnuibacter physcomitrellae]GGI38135.1 hypothetical protein GCM10010988_17480 [Cnuibacter physcomitrellae]
MSSVEHVEWSGLQWRLDRASGEVSVYTLAGEPLRNLGLLDTKAAKKLLFDPTNNVRPPEAEGSDERRQKHLEDVQRKVRAEGRRLVQLSYETQQRYHDAMDLLAGVKSGQADRSARRRATLYVQSIRRWLRGEDDG